MRLSNVMNEASSAVGAAEGSDGGIIGEKTAM